MKKIVALPALVLVFGLAACATTKKETPPPAASTPAPYAGQATPGEPELLGAPKKEQGS
ncbi:MAG: hypothetical protein ABWZ40_03115 [Caulobacterales bacterium]